MARLIDRYVVREVVPPFLAGLLLVAFALLADQVLLLAELFIAKRVPFAEALGLIAGLIPSILVFALPMAVLMGVLGGLARLSADSEIVAFRSLGIGPARLARPVALFGLAVFLLTLPLALWLAPRANAAWVRSMADSVIGRAPLDVRPLEFDETLPGTVLLVRAVEDGGRWRDVFVYLGADPARPRLVLARSGSVRLYPGERRAVLALDHGTAYAWPASGAGADTVTAFERLEEEIDVAGLFAAASREKGVREKDLGELVRDLRALEAGPAPPAPSRPARAHRVEIHKKFALAAACLVFALLGLPLGVLTGRAGRTGGFTLGLAVILVFYALLMAGENASMAGRLSPVAAMWGPNALFAAAGVLLLMRARRSPVPARVPTLRPRRRSDPPVPTGVPADTLSGRPVPALRSGPPFRFPGLLDRYVSRKFLSFLALALAALAAAAFLAVFFEHLGEALAKGKPAALVARYAAARLPGLLAFLLPAAVLVAAVLALGVLVRTNEATAMKACGVSAYRLALPVLVLGAAAAGAAFLVQERVAPAARARSEAARAALLDLPSRAYSFVNRHWVLSRSGDRVFRYDLFDPATATFARLSVFDLDLGRGALVRRAFAERAVLEDGLLRLSGAAERRYDRPAGGPPVPAGMSIDIASERAAFLEPFKEPPQMTWGELRRYAAEVRGLGLASSRLRTEVALRAALPAACLVMALLAVPFGFRTGRRGVLAGLGLAAVLAVAFWGVFALCRGLGMAGALPPFLAAWGANLVFGLGGIAGLLRTRT